jgi:Fe-S oxidoreductase
MISMGLQGPASEQARIVTEAVNLLGRRGCEVVMCEPSCVIAIREDYKLLMPREMLGTVADHVFMLDEWLLRLADSGALPADMFREMPGRVLLHGHCQQKALIGIEPTVRLLKLIPGLEIEVADSGCCGMAGAFGYEKEHYDISLAMGEHRLLPAVRAFAREKGPHWVVAAGTSCRSQIKHGAEVHALHPAQLLARALRAPET